MSDDNSNNRQLDDMRETFREKLLPEMEESDNPSDEATDLLDAISEENPSPDEIGERFGDWVDNLTDNDENSD